MLPQLHHLPATSLGTFALIEQPDAGFNVPAERRPACSNAGGIIPRPGCNENSMFVDLNIINTIDPTYFHSRSFIGPSRGFANKAKLVRKSRLVNRFKRVAA
jgi:hypothetical protein